MNVWGKGIPGREPRGQVQRPWNKMCLAYSRDIKEASVSPVVRVRVREVESEFEGTANVKSCRAIVKALGFILSVMKASGELKTEE